MKKKTKEFKVEWDCWGNIHDESKRKIKVRVSLGLGFHEPIAWMGILLNFRDFQSFFSHRSLCISNTIAS